MLMETRVALRGNVATTPDLRATPAGAPVADFRLAVTHRRFSREEQRWIDAGTSWCTVTAWRSLAANVAGCLQPGTPVLVEGTLRVREYAWEGTQRTKVEVDADAIGVELTWGTAAYTPNRRPRLAAVPAQAGEESGAPDGTPTGQDGPEGPEGPAGPDDVEPSDDADGLDIEADAVAEDLDDRFAGAGNPF